MWRGGDRVGVVGDEVGEEGSTGREDEVGGEPEGEKSPQQEGVQLGDGWDGGGRGVHEGGGGLSLQQAFPQRDARGIEVVDEDQLAGRTALDT